MIIEMSSIRGIIIEMSPIRDIIIEMSPIRGIIIEISPIRDIIIEMSPIRGIIIEMSPIRGIIILGGLQDTTPTCMRVLLIMNNMYIYTVHVYIRNIQISNSVKCIPVLDHPLS